MKDSQPEIPSLGHPVKYIKANNERFSTIARAGAHLD